MIGCDDGREMKLAQVRIHGPALVLAMLILQMLMPES